jgi:hypothetical protein
VGKFLPSFSRTCFCYTGSAKVLTQLTLHMFSRRRSNDDWPETLSHVDSNSKSDIALHTSLYVPTYYICTNPFPRPPLSVSVFLFPYVLSLSLSLFLSPSLFLLSLSPSLSLIHLFPRLFRFLWSIRFFRHAKQTNTPGFKSSEAGS